MKRGRWQCFFASCFASTLESRPRRVHLQYMTATHLAARALIRLSATEKGEDVRDFLQGLVTHDTKLLGAIEPLWAGLLTPQGKALFDFLLWADGADVLIDCEAAQAQALVRRLSLYRLRRKIEIALDPVLGVHWSKPDSLRSTATGLEALRKADDPRLAELGHRWIGPLSGEDASAAFRAHRLSLGVTEGVAELGSDATLWLEANAAELNGVSFTKGCYVGQENTARMNWRAKVNRRLVVVPLAQADEKRQRIAYPELGLSVEHRRVEDLAGLNLPEWMPAAAA